MKSCPQCQRTYADDMEFCAQDGTRLVASINANEGQLAAGLSRRFRIVRRLGAGGMGTVYLAQQIGVGNRPVALKVLNRKLLDDPEFLQRFQDEAGSTGRIHHPNVVTIYEAAQADDGTPYIAMEFLDGETLRDALEERGGLPVEECADILNQTAHGLNAAHKLGIIHRDLKPDNIFLTRGDGDELVVKVVDFGIAKLRESVTHTITGMVLGTPAYMSPEQASGIRSDQLDLRSDVYSLGIVVYETLTGALPFHSDTPLGYLRKHMLEAPAPLRSLKSGMPVAPDVEAVVMRALAKNREDRFASAVAFANEFSRSVSAVATAEPLRTTRVIEPGDWSQQNQESVVAGPAPAAPRHASVKTPSTPVPHSVLPEPPVKKVQPAPPQSEVQKRVSPSPVPAPRSAEAVLETQPAPLARRHRFFKIGFWILGISNMIGLLERVINLFVYRFHFGSIYILGFLFGIVLDAVFIVVYCRYLAKRRNAGLLWIAIALTILGGLVAPFAMSEMAYHFSSSTRGFLFFLDGIAFSSGLPLGSLVSPFIRYIGIRSGIWVAVVMLDTVAKLIFFILALIKYKDKPATPLP
jgi:serine/threonine protein kinase